MDDEEYVVRGFPDDGAWNMSISRLVEMWAAVFTKEESRRW